MNAHVKSFWKDESGQAQVEYGMVIALVAIALVGAMVIFRDKLSALLDRIGAQMDAAAK